MLRPRWTTFALLPHRLWSERSSAAVLLTVRARSPSCWGRWQTPTKERLSPDGIDGALVLCGDTPSKEAANLIGHFAVERARAPTCGSSGPAIRTTVTRQQHWPRRSRPRKPASAEVLEANDKDPKWIDQMGLPDGVWPDQRGKAVPASRVRKYGRRRGTIRRLETRRGCGGVRRRRGRLGRGTGAASGQAGREDAGRTGPVTRAPWSPPPSGHASALRIVYSTRSTATPGSSRRRHRRQGGPRGGGEADVRGRRRHRDSMPASIGDQAAPGVWNSWQGNPPT